MTELSVVLITKNQEWNVPRLVESVLAQTASLPSAEVLIVDSASTDRTVELASDYKIRVIRLDSDQRLTAGMGRYVGANQTTSDLILFLDGDMELGQGWLAHALDVLQQHPDVAVVSGMVIDRPVGTPYDHHFVAPPLASKSGRVSMRDIPYTGGAALYRRSVLEQVGSFHPYVYSDEEPELCIRIRHHGHRIVKLDYPIAYHYSKPTEAISTLVGRWKRNLYLGAGQNLRYNLGQDTFVPYARQRGYGLVPAVGLLAGVLSVLWFVRTGKWYGFALWTSLFITMIAVDGYRKRSLYRAVFSLMLRLLIIDGTVRGFMLPPLDVIHHPVRYQVVQPASGLA